MTKNLLLGTTARVVLRLPPQKTFPFPTETQLRKARLREQKRELRDIARIAKFRTERTVRAHLGDYGYDADAANVHPRAGGGFHIRVWGIITREILDV